VSTPCVLVVEDNASARKLFQETLAAAGYDVLAAADARSAHDVLETDTPDAIVLDLVLPDGDGFEIARSIRESKDGATVPLIACSGFMPHEERARIAAAGFDEFLVKPVEPSRLVETVRHYLPVQGPGSAPRPSVATMKTGKRVLVVDDDATQRKLLTTHLEREGFEVMASESGEEALELAGKTLPDAVASDVLMPGLNGFGLCLAIRRDPTLEKLPIVLFSAGYVEPQDCQVAKSVGATAFVVRSPDFHEVVEILEACLFSGEIPAPRPPADEVETPRTAPVHRMLRHLERQSSLNAQLVQECSVQAAGLAVLGAVSNALARSGDLEAALHEALSCCLEASGITAAAIFTDERLHAHKGLDAAAERDLHAVLSTARIRDRVFLSETPVPLPEPCPGLAFAIVAPIALRGESLGALVLGSRDRELEGKDWLAFARTVAAQLAQALTLARSFERLKESETRHRALMEQAQDAILVLDERGVTVELNRRAEELLARPAREVVGTRIAAFSELVASGTSLVEIEFDSVRGKKVPLQVSAAPVTLGARKSSLDGGMETRRLTVLIARDLSELKAATSEQSRLHAQADQLVRDRDELFAAAAQELRTPLDGVARHLDQISKGNLGPLAAARREVDRLSRLLDLHFASRSPVHDVPLPREEVDLAALVQEVANRFDAEASESGSPLDVRVPEPVTGSWNRVCLDHVVTALLAQALRHGTGKPILVAVDRRGGAARLTVADGGSGIAFPDADFATPGLLGVRRIVEALGGSLALARLPGGSSIVVTLP
jgi:PAS domain S-box-containing protein